MKKIIKTKKIIKESVGRDLIGASNFASRGSVSDKIIEKYPNPKLLSKAFLEIASKTKDSRAKQKLIELSQKCAELTPEEYPVFVKKVAGFSKLWTIVGATTAIATLSAATAWFVNAIGRAEESFKGHGDIVAPHSKMDTVKKAFSTMGEDVVNTKDNIMRGINNWRAGKSWGDTTGQLTPDAKNAIAFAKDQANKTKNDILFATDKTKQVGKKAIDDGINAGKKAVDFGKKSVIKANKSDYVQQAGKRGGAAGYFGI